MALEFPWVLQLVYVEESLKHEYHEGPAARKQFDEGMTKLFRVPKSAVTEEKPKPKPKRKKDSKG
jgi:hypothetical protein